MREMISQAIKNGLQFKYVLGDSWFASVENMSFIQKKKKFFIFDMQSNRLAATAAEDRRQGRWTSINQLEIPDHHPVKVWLKDLGFPVLMTKQIFTNKDETVNREITVIASALHSAYLDFPELETWNCPKIPRPKYAKSRRERLITTEETIKILTHLLSAEISGETKSETRNRQRVGRIFHFALLSGARIGEITALCWSQIDFCANRPDISERKRDSNRREMCATWN